MRVGMRWFEPPAAEAPPRRGAPPGWPDTSFSGALRDLDEVDPEPVPEGDRRSFRAMMAPYHPWGGPRHPGAGLHHWARSSAAGRVGGLSFHAAHRYRKAGKRGMRAKKRGIPKERVCVPTSVDRRRTGAPSRPRGSRRAGRIPARPAAGHAFSGDITPFGSVSGPRGAPRGAVPDGGTLRLWNRANRFDRHWEAGPPSPGCTRQFYG